MGSYTLPKMVFNIYYFVVSIEEPELEEIEDYMEANRCVRFL